tara:strand:- start:8040 stop:8384 length:345 start_codon:yes stop_codon:yes gene_type:complete
MYSLTFLNRENDLNKVIKQQKKYKHSIKILFVSLWDKWSQDLVSSLKQEFPEGRVQGTESIYIVDSFSMPHSFVIFDTKDTPQLVSLSRDKVVKEERLPLIYKILLQHTAYSKV